MRFMRNKKGFTMVELIVVLIIVGAIAASGFILLRSNQDKFTAQEGIQTMGSLARAIQQEYKLRNWITFNGATGQVIAMVPGMNWNSIGWGRYYGPNSFYIGDIVQTGGTSGVLTFELRAQRFISTGKWLRIEQTFSTDPDLTEDTPTMSYAETSY